MLFFVAQHPSAFWNKKDQENDHISGNYGWMNCTWAIYEKDINECEKSYEYNSFMTNIREYEDCGEPHRVWLCEAESDNGIPDFKKIKLLHVTKLDFGYTKH